MRKNFMILLAILLVILVLVGVGAYILFTPQYKTIDLNGYSFEVPSSNSNVTKVNDNYMTYDDKERNLTIKSYAINNINETNYTWAGDVGWQIGSNTGQNTTIENKTVMNQSGKYTYYDMDDYQMIVVTTTDYESMNHILKTFNKTKISQTPNNSTLNLTTLSVDTEESNNTTATNTKKAQSKKSSSKSKSSPDTINGEKIIVKHDFAGDPNVEYIGTKDNIYLKDKKTGKTAKRYLDDGVYYFK